MELVALLNDLQNKLKIDEDRIYLTGLSMGGFGTWRTAFYAPRKFAAIAPICGGGETYWAKQIAHLPVWAFHGAKDEGVPPERSKMMVEAIKKHGGDPKLTIYPEAEHDSWTETYNNPELYRWLLKQKRNPKELPCPKTSFNSHANPQRNCRTSKRKCRKLKRPKRTWLAERRIDPIPTPSGPERDAMTENSPNQQLDQMITGYWISQAIYAAAKFGIADHLKHGPKSVEMLSEATSTHPDALYRLLRALASVGIFAETEPHHFSLTPLAEPLRSDVPGSKRALALMSGDEQFRAWAEIEYSIRTGRTAFEKVYGEPVFDYLADHPDKARIFDAAMTGIHGRESNALLDAYDFSTFGTIADIGGGNGSQITGILQHNLRMRGILFDLPHVVERAKERIGSARLSDRCQLVGGSFFEQVPEGADAYILRHIIHDWDEEKILTILRNVHKAMSPTSKLLVVESVIPPGNEPFGGKLLDLVMLLIPGGKERTEEEYRDLFDQAGFELTQVVPTSTEVSILEGRKR